jgi:hypothetical protein
MPAKVYTRELLMAALLRDDATLIGEYDRINKNVRITFRCKCGTENSKRVFYIVAKEEGSGARCEACKKVHMVATMRESMLREHGVSHPMHAPEFKKKQEETMLANHGVRHNSLNPITVEKRKKTLEAHFGGHHFKLPEKLEERRQTYQRNYGVDHPLQRDDILAKQRGTNIRVRGVEYSQQDPRVREKAEATCLAKFGVRYPAQNPEIAAKCAANAKKPKPFTMPSGDVRMVQGYEPFALRDLLEMGITEEQIVTGTAHVPKIPYIAVDEKARYHFPDIFIPHLNWLVEVKSTWTLACKRDNILAKKTAAEAVGFKYDIWCFTPKGLLVDVDGVEQILASLDEVTEEDMEEDTDDSASEPEDDGTAAGGAGV